jgi:hypothetical protein
MISLSIFIVFYLSDNENISELKTFTVLEGLPLYPESRDLYAPTTNLLMQNFNKVCAYRLEDNGEKVIKTFKDELRDLQIKILELVGLSGNEFWGQEFCVK